MSTYTQTGRPLSISTPLGSDVLLLTGVDGVEAVSSPFRFELTLLSESPNTVSFSKLLGQPVTVTLQTPACPTRYINGIVTRLIQGPEVVAAKGAGTFVRYRAVINPKFWLLTKRVQSRIFQQLTVPQILQQVLKGIDVRQQLTGTYQPRDYCVQYRESDFAFASRLMEEEGICYFFEHGENSHTMIVSDSATSFAPLPSQSQLSYAPLEGGPVDFRRIHEWEKQQDVASSQYTLRDHCFELQEHDLEYAQTLSETVAAGSIEHPLAVGAAADLTIYDYPGRYAQRFDGVSSNGETQANALSDIFADGERAVRIRMEQEAAQSLKVRGVGDFSHLTPGYMFTLVRHFNGNGDYVLTEVAHTLDMGDSYITGEARNVEYRNRFECIPAKLTYRPQRVTACPRIEGTQSATVVGPAGEQVFCDKYGRVKVQFRWDRQGKNDAASSCWLRVAQPWAGQGYGSFHLPRVGQEVVVAFEEGDPDKPIIIGSVYNSANAPPFPLPENALQTGIKSSTLDGKANNFSGLGFDDTPGYEHVQLHSERHQTQSAEGNLFVDVGQQHHVSIGQVHTRQVGGLPTIDIFVSESGPSISGGQQGSGSGGGSSSSTYRDGSKFTWNFPVAGGKAGEIFGLDSSLTFGWQFTDLLGVYMQTIIGQKIENVWDPLAFGGDTAFKWLGEVKGSFLATFLGAKNQVVLGGQTVIHYGTSINIQRGSRLEAANDKASLSAAVFKKAGLAYIGMQAIDALLPAFAPYLRAQTGARGMRGIESAAFLVTDFFLSLWTVLEIDAQKMTLLDNAASSVKVLADTVTNFPYLPNSTGLGTIYTVLSGYAKPIGGAALSELSSALTSIANGEQPAGNIGVSKASHDEQSGIKAAVASTQYCITAPTICLLSEATTEADGNVILQANGSGTMGGYVTLVSSTAASIAGGSNALLSLSTKAAIGEIILDCGDGGGILLQSGPVAAKENWVTISTDGIEVVSALKITLKVGNIKVIVDEDGIQLQLDADNYIYLLPAEIKLNAGPSSLTVSSDGIILKAPSIGNQADTSYKITTAGLQAVE